jgi:uncharacterized membrane protein YjgN (DUF898 family)
MDPSTAESLFYIPEPSRVLRYDGRIGELYGIFLINILFTILTLGIFRFWAITRYRRYLWSHMRFQNQRFEYTGTGGEIFVGFLLAGLVMIGAAILAGIAAWALSHVSPFLAFLPFVLLYLFLVVLGAGAIFAAQRYRLGRTQWCGIRGGMQGSMLAYGVRALLYGFLAGITLFQMLPWIGVRLAERRINASSFGSARFAFHGRAKQLYGPFVLTFLATGLLLILPATPVGLHVRSLMPALTEARRISGIDPKPLADVMRKLEWSAAAAVLAFLFGAGLLRCWYVACFERHVVGNSSLGPVHLISILTGRALFGLMLGNACIMLFTLGLGYPVTIHRTARLLGDTIWTKGVLDLATLTQSPLQPSRYGEGFYQQLDAGGALF